MATDARTSAMSSAGPEKLGYAEYCMLPADDKRHEIIDGEHVVTPAPSTTHQTVSKRLLYELYTQLELTDRGLVFAAPVDVQLTEHDIVQPDLVVILKDRADIVTASKIAGVPDLVIEILSPSSRTQDSQVKLRAYERTGVAEYWLADPDSRTLERYRLRDGRYQREPAADPVEAFDGCLSIRLADIW